MTSSANSIAAVGGDQARQSLTVTDSDIVTTLLARPRTSAGRLAEGLKDTVNVDESNSNKSDH